jgi:hypothetical protein
MNASTLYPTATAPVLLPMNLAALAFLSGALLFVTSTAVVALQLSELTSQLWWAGLGAVAVCHAMMGFLAMRGPDALAQGHRAIAVFCLATSFSISAAIAAVAALAATLFPIALTPGVAMAILAASVGAGVVFLTVGVGLSDARR